MNLSYFDANVCIGKRGLKHPLSVWKTEDVLKIMDQCGIGAALACSGWAKDYAPQYGNERLMEELAKSSKLFGCYTIMPGYLGDFPSPEETIRDFRNKNMAAAKIYPMTHEFTPDERTMGEYYTALEQQDIPLLIDANEIKLRDSSYCLEALLSNHPKLNVVLLGVYWDLLRMVYPLLRDYTNLYLDLSLTQTNYGIEVLSERIGADRLLFGSGLPQMSAGAARSFIDYADIPVEDKQKIAGGNLARLCHLALPAYQKPDNDFIAQEAAEGKPLSVFVFDSHTHILSDSGGCGGGRPMPRGDLANMAKLFASMGVDRYCAAPWLGIWTDSEAGNEAVLSMARQDPKVCPYVLIDSNYVADVAQEARRCHIDHKMPGVKMLYTRTLIPYNDPVFDPWWEIAEENHLFALMDYGMHPNFLETVEELAIRYPNVSFFLDHAGRSFEAATAYAPYAQKYNNIYLQITYTTVTQGVIEYFVKEGLASKTLYGTDSPMRDPRQQLGWVAFADIPPEDKKLILGENMRRIYCRCFCK